MWVVHVCMGGLWVVTCCMCAWSVCVVCVGGLCRWFVCVVHIRVGGLHGWFVWVFHMVGCVGGLHGCGWSTSVWVVCMGGLYGWYVWVVCVGGLHGWSAWVVCMGGPLTAVCTGDTVQGAASDGDDLLALQGGHPARASHVVVGAVPQAMVVTLTPGRQQQATYSRHQST